MTKSVYPLILLSVAISAFAQIALKAGMGSQAVQRALANGMRVSTLVDVTFNPFVALGFLLTALLGRFFFHDSFSAGKIIGTLLIMAGVVVLARG